MPNTELLKPFQIRENFLGERILITNVTDDFCFYMYSDGTTCSCQNCHIIEKLVKQYDNFITAVQSPEFRLKI